MSLESFVKKSEIEQIYLDTPYYLTPSDKVSLEAFAVIRDALAEKKMAGLARIVLYRRERPVVIEPLGKGMLLTTLRYDRTVRQPETVFDEIGKVSVDQEMTDLAAHIIDKKKGKFDPSKFDDRYEDALLALIKAKKAGKKPPVVSAAEPPSNVINLFDALKKSLASEGGKSRREGQDHPRLATSLQKKPRRAAGDNRLSWQNGKCRSNNIGASATSSKPVSPRAKGSARPKVQIRWRAFCHSQARCPAAAL